ncbi:MAG: signal transduction histidine kinase [Crocinitomix sp.]|jgi:signal transduction histidine kinase
MRRIFSLITVLILFNSVGFSQEKSSLDFISKEIIEFPYVISGDLNFRKAYTYLLAENFDSSLVYSSHFLVVRGTNDKYTDYCHYFRGYSLLQKKLFKEAQKEFLFITNEFKFQSLVQMQMGIISVEQHEYAIALDYFSKIEKERDTEMSDVKEGTILHNMGICYLHTEAFEKSEKYLLKSIALQEADQDTLLIIGTYMDIANLYYVQYRDNDAIPYFIKAYSLSKQVPSFNLKNTAAFNMSIVEENRSDFVKALEYRKEAEQWTDSLNNQNKVWAVAEQEKKFLAEYKQKEIEVLEKDVSIGLAERNNFIFVASFFLILAILLLYFYQVKKKTTAIILVQKKELDVLNQTKDRLFSIVGHDLRSSLNALADGNKKIATELVDQTVSLKQLNKSNSAITSSTQRILDNMLNWALLQTEQLYFNPEKLNLKAVVNQVIFNFKPILELKEIDIKIEIESNIIVIADLDSFKITIRNIIDNALKYSKNKGRISITAKQKKINLCQLSIADNGPGIAPELRDILFNKNNAITANSAHKKVATGLGLQLCKEMIVKNKGELHVESEVGEGTCILITIPTNND